MEQVPLKKILVLDGQELSTLSIVRSLGRQALTVTVAAESDSAIAFHSKYAQHTHTYTNPLTHPEQFVADIVALVKAQEYALVIPVTELTSLPLAQARDAIEAYTTLAVAPNAALSRVTNKAETFKIADEVGVPTPKGVEVTSCAQLETLSKTLAYPVVLKPTRSIADIQGDVRAAQKVQYAMNPEELIELGTKMLACEHVMLQTFFRGVGVGIELLAEHGNILIAFQHERMHELPLTGGGSCLRKSVVVDPQLLDYSKRLIQELDWHGVAMVEYKHNPTEGTACLMEINGRFWGSLPLASFSGVNFPYALYQLLVLKQQPTQPEIKIGTIARNMQKDLYWYLQVIFRRDKHPLIQWPSYTKILRDWFLVFSPKHHIDAFARDDMKPGWVEIKRTLSWFFQSVQEFAQKRALKYRCQLKKKWGMARRRIKRSEHILFLCYGNINRSAIAEKLLEQAGYPGQITSAGFHPVSARPADPTMVDVAQRAGVDMQHWASRTVDQKMVDAADTIFVMEVQQLMTFASQYPKAKHKVMLLSMVDASSNFPLDIADPYGKCTENYETCFNLVQQATQEIIQLSKS